MEYIRATIKDVDELCKIRIAFLKDEHPDWTDKEINDFSPLLPIYFNKHLNKDFVAYICKDNARIIATVFLMIFEKPANRNYPTGKVGTIVNVYTEPNYRNQGIATQLLRMAITDGKQYNLSFIDLKATKLGEPVYRKVGFVDNESNYKPMKINLL